MSNARALGLVAAGLVAGGLIGYAVAKRRAEADAVSLLAAQAAERDAPVADFDLCPEGTTSGAAVRTEDYAAFAEGTAAVPSGDSLARRVIVAGVALVLALRAAVASWVSVPRPLPERPPTPVLAAPPMPPVTRRPRVNRWAVALRRSLPVRGPDVALMPRLAVVSLAGQLM